FILVISILNHQSHDHSLYVLYGSAYGRRQHDRQPRAVQIQQGDHHTHAGVMRRILGLFDPCSVDLGLHAAVVERISDLPVRSVAAHLHEHVAQVGRIIETPRGLFRQIDTLVTDVQQPADVTPVVTRALLGPDRGRDLLDRAVGVLPRPRPITLGLARTWRRGDVGPRLGHGRAPIRAVEPAHHQRTAVLVLRTRSLG